MSSTQQQHLTDPAEPMRFGKAECVWPLESADVCPKIYVDTRVSNGGQFQNQSNVIYFGPGGSPTASGLSHSSMLDTFANAVAKVATKSPSQSNQWALFCASDVEETIANVGDSFTLQKYVHVCAPYMTLSAGLILMGGNRVMMKTLYMDNGQSIVIQNDGGVSIEIPLIVMYTTDPPITISGTQQTNNRHFITCAEGFFGSGSPSIQGTANTLVMNCAYAQLGEVNMDASCKLDTTRCPRMLINLRPAGTVLFNNHTSIATSVDGGATSNIIITLTRYAATIVLRTYDLTANGSNIGNIVTSSQPIPEVHRPLTPKMFSICVINNGVAELGWLTVQASGNIAASRIGEQAFFGTVNNGWRSFCVTYAADS